MMGERWRWFGWTLAAGFVAGMAIGAMLADRPVHAGQTFGPEDVKSVPQAYLQGGDRNYTVLKDILQEMKANGQRMQRMETAVNRIHSSTQSIAKKIDITNKLLSGGKRQ